MRNEALDRASERLASDRRFRRRFRRSPARALRGSGLGEAEIEALSKLPGRDELRAQLLSVFLASGTQLVRVLAARPVEFLQVLKARATDLEEAA